MAESDLELQLKVWKELAISKQILMRAATDALKLDPNCSQEELKIALDAAIKRSIEADVEVRKAQEQARIAAAEMDRKLAGSRRAREMAEAAYAAALADQQKLQQQIEENRSNAAKEFTTLKERIAERERELKAINTALSDTPQNVVKKLKALKKQKLDESEARQQAEENAAGLRKERKKLEETVKEMQAAQDNASQLAALYRELHTFCGDLHSRLASLVEDAKSLPVVPKLNDALLEGIEKVDEREEKKPVSKVRR